MRHLIVTALTACLTATAAVGADPELDPSEYKPSYKATQAPRGSIGIVPKADWGEAVKGLQVALVAPDRIRLNEEGIMYVVVRNVSDGPIRALFHDQQSVNFRPVGNGQISYGMNSPGDRVTRWEIAPGEQIALRCGPLWVKSDHAVGPKGAMKSIKPGSYELVARLSGGGEHWVSPGGSRPAIKVVTREGEWRGGAKSKPQKLEVIDETVPFELRPPIAVKLIPGQKLEPSLERPKLIDSHKHDEFKLGDGANLYLNKEADEHWIWHWGSYNKSVFWGPFSEQDLAQFGLVDLIEVRLVEGFSNSQGFDRGGWDGVRSMLRRSERFARLGLKVALGVEIPDDRGKSMWERGGHLGVLRTISDRRVELREMGLGEEIAAVVEKFEPDGPVLPDEAEFKVVASEATPAELEGVAWGPENDGLQAAAVMPAEIRKGEAGDVRLFIRNVSDQAIYVALSDRPGYDVIRAVDPTGNQLGTTNARPYSKVILAGRIWQEIDPGSFTENPPSATLTKYKLEAGAFFELKTKTRLSHGLVPHPAIDLDLQQSLNPEPPTVVTLAVMSPEPTTVSVTWELHSANGFEYSEDLKKRLWPAKGSWTGILTTAPAEVKLSKKGE